eukprot:TRINITY_DN7826_c0_g1_i1.p1 TRINITY_DN7826_c0_g1~~TRINITY_DN7826_c0_g1_i1.p1  ORF type:complete len:451 (-),score=67.53 TRINITY_DN7826_c0_g1_i1:107-1459(-)
MGAQCTQHCAKPKLERIIECNCADFCERHRQATMEHSQGVHGVLNSFVSDSGARLNDKRVSCQPSDAESQVFPLESYEAAPKRNSTLPHGNSAPLNFGEVLCRQPHMPRSVRAERAIVSPPVPCRSPEGGDSETDVLCPSVFEDAQRGGNFEEVETSPELIAAELSSSNIDECSQEPITMSKQFVDEKKLSQRLTATTKPVSEDEKRPKDTVDAPSQATSRKDDKTPRPSGLRAAASEAFDIQQKMFDMKAAPVIDVSLVDEGDAFTLAAEAGLLQGVWGLARTNVAIAMLTESQVHWWPRNGLQPDDFKITEHGTISLVVNGEVCEGTLSSNAPSRYRLNWSDGEVWEKLKFGADDLSGVWRTVGDRLPIARITNGRVSWELRFKEAPLELYPLPVNPGGKVSGNMNGDVVTAIYFPPPWSCLEWSDGDVWIRVPMAQMVYTAAEVSFA